MTAVDRIKAALESDAPGRVEWRTQLETALFEIERLRALVTLASDAYENGGEDDCCVACAEIAKAVAAEQKESR